MSDDYVVQVVERFCSLTGKLICSPADYQVAMDWEIAEIPVGIVLLAIEVYADVNREKKWLRRAPLEWLNPMVQEGYQSWKRAVGPSYRSLSRG